MKLVDELGIEQNFTSFLDKDEKEKLASKLLSLILADKQSRSQWEEENAEWFKLASQVLEKKHTPWPNASNIKFPLLTLTSVHFQARAAKDLLGSTDIVRTKYIGLNKTPKDDERGARIAHALSYQIQEVIPRWAEDMEQGLMVLPLYGMFFKKTFYNPSVRSAVSKLVFPTDLIYHYGANDFTRCRKTELIPKYTNEIAENIRQGYYDDYDLSYPVSHSQFMDYEYNNEDDDSPRMLLECHCWYDLDGDGYKEPWVITIDESAREIIRIAPRFSVENVVYQNSKIVSIKADEYYTQYGCIPSFNSKTYYAGFGQLLGPVNAGVNSVLNQLIDSGTLSNLPSGFISKGLRVRRGEEGFAPGQWKQTMTNNGEPLAKNIFPLPVQSPSPVLFQLLGLLIQAGKEIGSLSDMILGNSPGQNTPASTTKTVMEQGLQVYSGVFKNVHRAMTTELMLLAKINQKYLEDETYNDILGLDESHSVQEDFDFTSISVLPTAEPNTVTEQQKLEKSARLLELGAAGIPLNPQVVGKRVLEAEGHENIPELMEMPPPQPDFDQQIEMQKLQMEGQRLQMEQMKFQQEMQLEAKNSQYEALKDLAQAKLSMAKAQQIGESGALETAKMQLEAAQFKADSEEKNFSRLMEVARVKGEEDKREKDYDVQRRAAATKGGPSQ